MLNKDVISLAGIYNDNAAAVTIVATGHIFQILVLELYDLGILEVVDEGLLVF